jgi:hypothetical protein
MSDKLWMVIDCESIGLHGETFAVGWVVVREDGEELSQGILACDPHHAVGDEDGWAWVIQNVPSNVFALGSCSRPSELRSLFWTQWQFWKEQGATLAADVPWPVEARFLIDCIRDDSRRTWEGPYPLIDIASYRAARGFDPLGTYDRRGELENPLHHPQADARQSARLLLEACQT